MSDSRILVAYFSHPGENYDVGNVAEGSTEIVARIIAEKTGADLFEIRKTAEYPESYDETTKVAQEEVESHARPALAEDIEDISGYDIVFIGYPIWFTDLPMPVYTFLESHDLNRKIVIPFCTHAGSGLSTTLSTIEHMFPKAKVLSGLSLWGTMVQSNRAATERVVDEFLAYNKLI